MSSNAPHHMRPRTLLSRCELPPPTYVGIVCNTCTMPCLCGSCLVMSCATWQPKLQPRLGSCTISVFACQAGPPHMQSQASPVSQHNGTWRPPVMVSLGSRILDIGPNARLKLVHLRPASRLQGYPSEMWRYKPLPAFLLGNKAMLHVLHTL